jgi:hypothetical protein
MAREADMMDKIRNEARVFEASRCRLLGLLEASTGEYPALGGNTMTDSWLDVYGKDVPTTGTYSMTKAEWQAFWPTLRTAITVSSANLASLMKGIL